MCTFACHVCCFQIAGRQGLGETALVANATSEAVFQLGKLCEQQPLHPGAANLFGMRVFVIPETIRIKSSSCLILSQMSNLGFILCHYARTCLAGLALERHGQAADAERHFRRALSLLEFVDATRTCSMPNSGI